MRKKMILFDLDGTLCPFNQDEFIQSYFSKLSTFMEPYGYQKETIIPAIWKGLGSMVMNDGTCTNEERFWDTFSAVLQKDTRKDYDHFERFYREEFGKINTVVHKDERVQPMIQTIKEKGYQVALATNPLFPDIATRQRIQWAGLEPETFAFYTTYENSCYCKPNLKYYEELVDKLGISSEECIMVGNDVDEDMIAEELGMDVYLITKYLINAHEKDISKYPQGDFEDFLKWLG